MLTRAHYLAHIEGLFLGSRLWRRLDLLAAQKQRQKQLAWQRQNKDERKKKERKNGNRETTVATARAMLKLLPQTRGTSREGRTRSMWRSVCHNDDKHE